MPMSRSRPADEPFFRGKDSGWRHGDRGCFGDGKAVPRIMAYSRYFSDEAAEDSVRELKGTRGGECSGKLIFPYKSTGRAVSSRK